MNDAVMEFYKVARRDNEMVSLLAGIEDETLFISTVVKLGRERGLSSQLKRQGLQFQNLKVLLNMPRTMMS